jgi:S1-C subfamily serine protease
MLFTGVHTDYHKPSDKWDKLNYAGEAHLLTFAESYLRTVGDAAVKPDLIKNPEYDSTVKKEKTAGHGAWLGIIPNFESNPLGFRISGTSSGGPAQKVGMQNDDIIIKIGDNVVRNFYDLNNILKQHFPGDVVKVVVLRKDKEKTFEVTLGKRD